MLKTLTLIAAAALALTSFASSADPASPFVGKWVLNVAKSTFDPPSPLKSHTFTMSEASGGGFHGTIDIVKADGSHLEFTTALDGKAVPVSGSPYADSVTVTLLNARMIKDVFRKAGKTVETGTLTVSKNGKIMVGPLAGSDAKGPWNYHYVFIRQ